MNPFNLTEGPWYVDLGALAGALAAASAIWKLALVPFLRGIWAAIKAAPQLADGVQDLVKLLVEGNILERLEEGSRRFAGIDLRLDDHDTRLEELEAARAARRAAETEVSS
ncbi:hypothetical protein UFOVP1383_42 [uncultured Caudovirales phage]|uniref:Uncharacterized protein n=1 Tax=uncultured Caudovirales phage TaxID=2100421 RepID=A0A6J5S6Z3_9CAUD|nr:hypothetical protein UFOVP848_58 [uncultured Caudovirales phage]CAB4172979.1 hypothetical protein UFOVP945_7 [uncultured Caudovirales phage]CAB4179653.1 hypothetical protein UFOVP1023_35 [uncultured Caudovirales phage]CAB4204233.1 hypothetical protein UFOVP1383_42 [uncultured Caudovirales phage]CAB4215818.1 hypothetical protein UFOVP1477_6 [uncultured Caudovirales phage]